MAWEFCWGFQQWLRDIGPAPPGDGVGVALSDLSGCTMLRGLDASLRLKMAGLTTHWASTVLASAMSET